ncbi:MAG TPA: transporter substrate-binding domain-containing protein [Burkholderiaceae bacterium]|nr:transporter substrate-binding domain-containing protein [Burkholderiaceae bacterium]
MAIAPVAPARPPVARWLRSLAVLLAALMATASNVARADADLDRIHARGTIKVAVYKDFFPFSEDGKGIDIELANALAERLGVRAEVLPFDAGEELGDDLRNMVWKGHYLGYGPADVMMHVPVDRVLQTRNDKVSIFGPYYRESIKLAIDSERISDWKGPDILAQEPVAVDGDSLSAQVILGADGGRYRDRVVISHGVEAAIAAVKSGRAAAILAARSELEAGLGIGQRYRYVDATWPGLPPAGWVAGLAVRSDSHDLERALQEALDGVTRDGTLARIFAQHGVTYTHP